jgi:hypothetical protein
MKITIKYLLDELVSNGMTEWDDLGGMSNLIIFYFGSFTSEVEEPSAEILDKVTPKVTIDLNNDLLAPFFSQGGEESYSIN